MIQYQSDEDAEELNHVCVGHRVNTANQGVENGDEGRNDD